MNDQKVLAMAWNIATEPKLYRLLSANPYSPEVRHLISEKFPKALIRDVIQAIVLAEPEGRYDRNFKQLDNKHYAVTVEITKRLNDYINKHKAELAKLSADLKYEVLFRAAFGTDNITEVEEKYSQNQRRQLKLAIVSFISRKAAVKDQPLKIAFSALSLLVVFYFALVQIESPDRSPPVEGRQVMGIATQKNVQTIPRRLKIPSLNVDSVIQQITVTSEGAMAVPSNVEDVGWYKLGSVPGERGSAVISGHFDGLKGEPGVFSNLNKLKPGDKIEVVSELGKTTTFIVRESRTYPPGNADEVFISTDEGKHLNLITCDGAWDEAKKSYTKRLVVFTDAL